MLKRRFVRFRPDQARRRAPLLALVLTTLALVLSACGDSRDASALPSSSVAQTPSALGGDPASPDAASVPPQPPAGATVGAPAAPLRAADAPALFGWIPYWDQDAAFASFQAHAELFTDLGLFWYHIDFQGRVQPYQGAVEDRALIDVAHEHNVRVMAVVSNLADSEGVGLDACRVVAMLNSFDARAAHIDALVNLTRRMDFDGVNISYLQLPPSARAGFTLFIDELGAALHAEGKLLGLTLSPKTSADDPQGANGSFAQDWTKLQRAADQLYLLAFGEHSRAGGPGSIASPAWVAAVLAYAVNDVALPPEQLFLAVPFFGQEWISAPTDGSFPVTEERTFKSTMVIGDAFGATPRWSVAAQSPYLLYQRGRAGHVIWYEDARSVSALLGVAQEFDVGALAVWRLGGEDPEIWPLFEGMILDAPTVAAAPR